MDIEKAKFNFDSVLKLAKRVFKRLRHFGGGMLDHDDTKKTGAILNEITTLTSERKADKRHELLWKQCEAIRRYLWTFQLDNASHEFVKSYVNDALPRFLHTLDLMPLQPGLKVLELGANPYLFTILLKKFHDYDLHLSNFFSSNIYEAGVSNEKQRIWSDAYNEDYSFNYVNFNIELSSYPYDEDTFDVILFCEILEHLIINPMQVFSKLKRILKPGGMLIITTPNAVRLINVALMIEGSNIFDRYHSEFGVYGRHNREFTCEELRMILQENGFELVTITTLDRYNYDAARIYKDNYEKPMMLHHSKKSIEKALRKSGGSLTHRGDNIYAVAKKI